MLVAQHDELRSLRLPNDVWDKILCHLDVITITKCRTISKQLHQVSYQILRRFRHVSLFKLFSEMSERPSKEDMIQTLNVLPELIQLTIGIPEAFFRFNVADTFCETHVSDTLQSVVFYGCALQTAHFLNFVTRCKSVTSIALCTHDSIDDELCLDLIHYCHRVFVRNGGRKRRLNRFELCATKKVSKDVLAQLTDGFVADSVILQALGQLDHAELGVREPSEDALSVLSSIRDAQQQQQQSIDNGDGDDTGCVDRTTAHISHFELRTNQHLRRLTIGDNGLLSGRQIETLDISRCPLYSFRILGSNNNSITSTSTSTSETGDQQQQQALGIKRLNITYGRWLSNFHCDIPNAFANLEHLDLTSSDALRPTSIDRLFGLGDETKAPKMRRLKTLILCDTLVENLWLCGYEELCKVDTTRCVMLHSVTIKECGRLLDLEMDLGSAPALELLDITVVGGCVVKGIPEFITVKSGNGGGGGDDDEGGVYGSSNGDGGGQGRNEKSNTRSFHFDISSNH